MSEKPSIIYEDHRFAAIEKPAGWMVHRVSGVKRSPPRGRKEKSRTADAPILTDWLLERYPEIKNVGDDPAMRPGIVHRLDRQVSGVMIVARTQEYFEYLKKLFQAHAVGKFYFAIVAGTVKEKHGFIDAPIGRRAGTLKRSVHSVKNAKEALTEYRVVKRLGSDATLLEVQTHTGRTHQIRVHLSSIGYPILGDELYGGMKSKLAPAKRFDSRSALSIAASEVEDLHAGAGIYLHAFRIEFSPEEGNVMRFETELPERFEKFLAFYSS